ncbi:MAG: hypothetical protein AAGA85_16765 [Bacteroidota bacterium]
MNTIRVIFMFLAGAMLSCATEETDSIEQKRDLLLKEHSFVRTAFDTADLELLNGNGEMGGLVKLNGLGFDAIWSSDLWLNTEMREALQGVQLSLD